MHFATNILKRKGSEFPPTTRDLVAWSAQFNVCGTYTNYLGYVKLACQILGVSTAVFSSDEVQRAKTAIAKRDEYRRRDPMFVRQTLLIRLVDVARGAKCTEGWIMAMLFVITYVSMLRLHLEALPIAVSRIGEGHAGQRAVISLEGDGVVLSLERRKNWQRGSVVRRSCWCSTCRQT